MWPGGSLNFQFSGVVIVSPGGCIFPSGSKTSRPAERKVKGTGSNKFARGSPGVIVVPPLFVPLDSWSCESGLWEKQPWTLDADSEQIQPLGGPCSSPAGHCHQAAL